MLMAKSCHDIDYLHYLIGQACLKASVVGSLSTSRPQKLRRARANDAWIALLSARVHYSAVKHYVETDRHGWPAGTVYDGPLAARPTSRRSVPGPMAAASGRRDNDVVDHQTVNMLFEDDVTVVFTMTGFTQGGGRYLARAWHAGRVWFRRGLVAIKTYADNNTTTIQIGPETRRPRRR